MDLLAKSIIGIAVVIVIIFGGFYALSSGAFAQPVTKQQAVSLVLNDLQNSNPGAIVNITNESVSQYPGSWHIVASVILNATSPCPSYSIYSFDYPKYGFVSRLENQYTSNCVIDGSSSNSTIIGSSSAAITRSYDLNNTQINEFVNTYGYSTMVVYATYHDTLNYSASQYTGVWAVEYTSSDTNGTVTALILQKNGSLIGVYTIGTVK